VPVAFVTTKQGMKRLLARLQPRLREYLSLESAFDLAVIALQFQRPTKRQKQILRRMHARLERLRAQLEALSEKAVR
jgi:hypothetical protein